MTDCTVLYNSTRTELLSLLLKVRVRTSSVKVSLIKTTFKKVTRSTKNVPFKILWVVDKNIDNDESVSLLYEATLASQHPIMGLRKLGTHSRTRKETQSLPQQVF